MIRIFAGWEIGLVKLADAAIATAIIAVCGAMPNSAQVESTISHPANILIMGPGGYRFSDYIKIGGPLTLIVFVAVMLLLPVFWPLLPAE